MFESDSKNLRGRNKPFFRLFVRKTTSKNRNVMIASPLRRFETDGRHLRPLERVDLHRKPRKCRHPHLMQNHLREKLTKS